MTFANVFDEASNLKTQDISLRPTENGLSTYAYDRLHRMLSRTYPDNDTEEVTFDDLSNWKDYTARDSSVTTYTDNILNQYTAISGGSSPLHDAKGNLTRNERGYGFSYDFENRLTRVFDDDVIVNGVWDAGETIHADYVYDALGRRVHVTGNPDPIVSERYRYYDGSVPVADFEASNPAKLVQVFINGVTSLDEKLILTTSGQSWYYIHKDLDTVAGIASAAGEIEEWYTYSAWGEPEVNHVEHAPCPFPSTGCEFHLLFNNPFYFTGQWFETLDSGGLLLYDYKARFYDPRHGRFQQRDPAEFGDAYNLYEYARSRVTVLTDPTGEFTIPSFTISFAIRSSLSALNIGGGVFQVRGIVKQFRSGVAIQQILMGILIDAAIDRVGGKLFDVVLGGLNRFTSSFFSKLRKVCCFVGGTLVDTPDGPVPIECIQPGDLVVTRDQYDSGGRLTVRPVTQVFQRMAPVILWLTLAGGEVLGATPGHLVWSNEKGWVYAGELSAGDTFLDKGRRSRAIIGVTRDVNATQTYNIEVAETGTYFAGGVWVHNTSCLRRRMEKLGPPPPHLRRPEAHHELPNKFRSEFEAAGLDIDDPAFGRWVEGGPLGDHQSWSRALQDEWEAFFANNADPSTESIIARMLELRNDPRFR